MKTWRAMVRLRLLSALPLIAVFWCIYAAAQSVTVTPLVTFNAVNNGDHPYAGLVRGSDGNFYGTTEFGGSNNFGTIFKMSPSGNLLFQTSFMGTNGQDPLSALAFGPDGNLYGVTFEGGAYSNGTFFMVTTNGLLTSILSFDGTNGANPWGELTLGSNGNFYGTTEYGGTNNLGTVFQLTTNGALTSMFSFAGTNGEYPISRLTLGNDGNFYGTTSAGGSNNFGTIFEITSSGSFTLLLSFNNTNGANPWSGLKLDMDGNFYGTTLNGGTNSLLFGTVFRFSTNGVLTTLYSFAFNDGKGPAADLTQDAYGNLYGTTTFGGTNSGSNGTLFRLTTNGVLTTLFEFSPVNNDGANPYGDLVFDPSGILYGTAWQGGQYGHGTVFVVSFPIVIQPSLLPNGNINLNFQTTLGQSYTVQYVTSLGSTNWVFYTNIIGTGFPYQLSIPATNASGQFFRIRTP